MKLEKQIAVVTGGGQGLGRVICMKLAEAGATVIIADINPETSAETAELIKKNFNRESLVVVTDLRKEAAVANLADTVRQQFGSLDILINNSGIAGPRSRLEDVSLEEWNESLAINITGLFLTCKYLAPLLKAKKRSTIVNIASTGGMRPLVMRMPYTTTKGAVIAFTKGLALEYGADGVRVVSICPGAFDGPRQDNVLRKVAEQSGRPFDDVVKEKKAEAVLNTFITPESIGDAVLFLCSSEGSFITGTNLNISAGLVLG